MSRGAAEHRALEVGYQQMRERAEQAERTRDDLRSALRGVVEDVFWEPSSLTDKELAIFERARAALLRARAPIAKIEGGHHG